MLHELPDQANLYPSIPQDLRKIVYDQRASQALSLLTHPQYDKRDLVKLVGENAARDHVINRIINSPELKNQQLIRLNCQQSSSVNKLLDQVRQVHAKLDQSYTAIPARADSTPIAIFLELGEIKRMLHPQGKRVVVLFENLDSLSAENSELLADLLHMINRTHIDEGLDIFDATSTGDLSFMTSSDHDPDKYSEGIRGDRKPMGGKVIDLSDDEEENRIIAFTEAMVKDISIGGKKATMSSCRSRDTLFRTYNTLEQHLKEKGYQVARLDLGLVRPSIAEAAYLSFEDIISELRKHFPDMQTSKTNSTGGEFVNLLSAIQVQNKDIAQVILYEGLHRLSAEDQNQLFILLRNNIDTQSAQHDALDKRKPLIHILGTVAEDPAEILYKDIAGFGRLKAVMNQQCPYKI